MTAAVLFSFALAALTVWGERKKTDRGRVLRINRILSLAGGVLLITSLAVGLYAVHSVSTLPSALEWTLTLCGGYALLVGPVFLVVLVSLLLSSLLRRRSMDNDSKGRRLVRIWLSTLASAACLLLSALWIAVSRGGGTDLTSVFLTAGFGCALVLRVTLLSEYRP